MPERHFKVASFNTASPARFSAHTQALQVKGLETRPLGPRSALPQGAFSPRSSWQAGPGLGPRGRSPKPPTGGCGRQENAGRKGAHRPPPPRSDPSPRTRASPRRQPAVCDHTDFRGGASVLPASLALWALLTPFKRHSAQHLTARAPQPPDHL